MKFLAAFFAYVVLELVLFIWVASLIGWLFVVGITIAGFLLGIIVMRDASVRASDTLRAANQGQSVQPAQLSDVGFRFTAGALIAIPGFFTDVVGLLLLIPFARRLAGGLGAAAFMRWARRHDMSVVTTTVNGETVTRVVPGDVVPGDVIRREDNPNGPLPPHPELGP